MSEEKQEFVIKKANFDNQKQELSKIKNELLRSKDLKLDEVKTDYFFKIFSHKVTGEELNHITGQIQEIFIGQNNTINNIINEFDTIYKTFEALDSEYLKYILASVAGVKKANDTAVESLEKVKNQQMQLTKDQSDIKKLVAQQVKVVKMLKEFQVRIDNIKHISDIDWIFSKLTEVKEATSNLNKRYESLEDIVVDNNEQFEKDIKQQKRAIQKLENILDQFDSKTRRELQKLNDKLVFQEKKTSQLEKSLKINTNNLNKNITDIEQRLVSDLRKEQSTRKKVLGLVDNKIKANQKYVINALEEQDEKVIELGKSLKAEFEENKTITRKNITKIEEDFIKNDNIYSKNFENQKQEIDELRINNQNLEKQLKDTRLFMYISVGIMCILLVLLISGVL